jgi:hypothetical protein
MPYDRRIDAYIAKSAEFARPILTRLRKVVHAGCPDVIETVKWGSPSFEYKGMFCGMAAFKQHAIFGFWKHKLLVERGLIDPKDKAMGQYGRITSLDDLPGEAQLIRVVREAARLNDEGIKVPRVVKAKKPPVKPPTYFTAALKKNTKALATFKAFSPSNQRDYVEWVTEAKTDDTRTRRLDTAVAWMAQGKIRNWKYTPKARQA